MFSESQRPGSHTGGSFCCGNTVMKKIARSEQLRDRYVTFVQKGLSEMGSFFELFNEQVC
jgi:hypothetical protein